MCSFDEQRLAWPVDVSHSELDSDRNYVRMFAVRRDLVALLICFLFLVLIVDSRTWPQEALAAAVLRVKGRRCHAWHGGSGLHGGILSDVSRGGDGHSGVLQLSPEHHQHQADNRNVFVLLAGLHWHHGIV